MAAIVHRGLQSHLESQHAESIALKLRLPSSTPPLPQFIDLAFKPSLWDSNSNSTIKPHIEENNNKKSTPTPSNPNSWSFLEALSNVIEEPPSSKNETTYVHPQQKRFSPSLELCTENLGNESGSDSDEKSIDMSMLSGTGEQPQQRQPRQLSTAKKGKKQNFPPPLTTIRGSESLRVRPHREDGRLVIEVTRVPPTPSCFHAERSHGRLRLCFLTNHTPSFDTEAEEAEDDVEENEAFSNEKEMENEMSGQVKDTKEETEEECVACGCVEESDVIIMEKYERLRRCKQGRDHDNNEFLNWGEPRLVATS